eukprot:955249-Amorphochlora_amoeboformis.AAC.1
MEAAAVRDVRVMRRQETASRSTAPQKAEDRRVSPNLRYFFTEVGSKFIQQCKNEQILWVDLRTSKKLNDAFKMGDGVVFFVFDSVAEVFSGYAIMKTIFKTLEDRNSGTYCKIRWVESAELRFQDASGIFNEIEGRDVTRSLDGDEIDLRGAKELFERIRTSSL